MVSLAEPVELDTVAQRRRKEQADMMFCGAKLYVVREQTDIVTALRIESPRMYNIALCDPFSNKDGAQPGIQCADQYTNQEYACEVWGCS